jgi:hypothetical protein
VQGEFEQVSEEQGQITISQPTVVDELSGYSASQCWVTNENTYPAQLPAWVLVFADGSAQARFSGQGQPVSGSVLPTGESVTILYFRLLVPGQTLYGEYTATASTFSLAVDPERKQTAVYLPQPASACAVD